MDTDPSIVEYSAEHERYRCGYCGSKDSNYSHGMWAHQMTVDNYQDLIDRGWRRSGMYCYKPNMSITCCPQYTIRCNAVEFKLSKSHKKIIKKVNKFLISGTKSGSDKKGTESQECEDEGSEEGHHVKDVGCALAEKMKPSQIILPKPSNAKESKKNAKVSVSETTVQSSTPTQTRSHSAPAVSLEDSKSQSKNSKSRCIPKPGVGPDPGKPKCMKAKEIRAQRKALKLSQAGDVVIKQKQVKKNQEKSLEEFLSEPNNVENPAHKLELVMVRSSPPSDAYKSVFNTEHSVYHKYQTTIHKDPSQKPSQTQYKQFLCDSPLAIVLCRTAPESLQCRLSFLESFAIYNKYQVAVHKDKPGECDKFGFKKFLVDSPLEEKYDANGPPEGYGSFHQHYLLDGKLIAVGVLDILPTCVSSVYLYYDPDYSFLGLGVYSALRELALVRQLHLSAPSLQYYYMGFYIHTCHKMRYKGQYEPSYLACPETYEWVPIEKCRQKLDVSRYSRFSESGTDSQQNVDVNQVLILYKGNMLPYGFYKIMKSHGSDEDEVKEYASLVGRTCAESMLLVRK